MEVHDAAGGVWAAVGGDPADLDGLEVKGGDPVLPSVFQVATAAAACVAAVTLGAALLWRDRGGPPPDVAVDVREAAIAFRSERHLRIDGEALRPWAPLSGDYPTGDGGWVRLHCNFPQHRDAVLAALGAPDDREAVAAEVARRAGVEVEDAVTTSGGCAAAMRTRSEWATHPQGRAVAGLPLVELTRLDDSRPRPLTSAGRPLAGVRVLDLTRVNRRAGLRADPGGPRSRGAAGRG